MPRRQNLIGSYHARTQPRRTVGRFAFVDSEADGQDAG